MKLTAAQLKYILVLGSLSGDKGIRTVDIAKNLNIQRSSAFNMLNRLSDAGLVIKNEDKTVILTDKGRLTSDRLRKTAEETVKKLEKHFGLRENDAEECALIILSCSEDI
jgi:Mn-dependent DtxR family transcriptional regulator